MLCLGTVIKLSHYLGQSQCCTFFPVIRRISALILLSGMILFLVQTKLVFSNTDRHAFSPSISLLCPEATVFPGIEALPSTIRLQMPFVAGQTWIAGGVGYFYGNGTHCNSNSEYYATDWNMPNDDRETVLPIAPGMVVEAVFPFPGSDVCPFSEGYGCYVTIDHANGFRSKYAHLRTPLVTVGTSVTWWNPIGIIGSTGNSSGPHLHLSFRNNNGGGTYTSYCWNGGANCPNLETPVAPQGYALSPLLTGAGYITLQGSTNNTSVNGRVYLPDLRNSEGWYSEIFIRNNSSLTRTLTVQYFTAAGVPTGVSDSCLTYHDQRCAFRVDAQNQIPAGANGSGWVEGGEDVSVVVVQRRTNPAAAAAYNGVYWPETTVPVPLAQRNNGGRSTELRVQNPSTAPTTLYVTLQPALGQAGAACGQTYPNVPARGTQVIKLSEASWNCLGAVFVGSAVITNSAQHPLAVAAAQVAADQSAIAESGLVTGLGRMVFAPAIDNRVVGTFALQGAPPAARPGSHVLYLPIVHGKQQYATLTTVAMQNASASAGVFTSTLYHYNGLGACQTATISTLPAWGSVVRVAGTNAACEPVASEVYSGGLRNTSAIVQQEMPGGASLDDYEAPTAGTSWLISPLWRNHQDWSSILTAQNVSGLETSILLLNFDLAGNVYTATVQALPPYGVYRLEKFGLADGALALIVLQPEPETAPRAVTAVVTHSLTEGDYAVSHALWPRGWGGP